MGNSAQEMQEALIVEVRKFISDEPQFDDITLTIVLREG
jgi:serine phosphatase RsbU (regulator of sigma subunit)